MFTPDGRGATTLGAQFWTALLRLCEWANRSQPIAAQKRQPSPTTFFDVFFSDSTIPGAGIEEVRTAVQI
jgi:hypothetical protein